MLPDPKLEMSDAFHIARSLSLYAWVCDIHSAHVLAFATRSHHHFCLLSSVTRTHKPNKIICWLDVCRALLIVTALRRIKDNNTTIDPCTDRRRRRIRRQRRRSRRRQWVSKRKAPDERSTKGDKIIARKRDYDQQTWPIMVMVILP